MASFPGQKGTGPPLPNQVVGLTATPISVGEIDLSWLPVPGATLYNIYRGGVLIGTDVTPPYQDLTVSASTTYTYIVSAVNANGEGLKSSPVNGTTPSASATGRVKWNSGWYAWTGMFHPSTSLVGSGSAGVMDEALGNVTIGGVATPQDWILGFNVTCTWSTLEYGPISFTSAVNGTSGTLTAAIVDENGTVINGVFWVRFSTGVYKDVTIVNGTQASWTGAVTATGSAWCYNFQLIEAVKQRCQNNYNKKKQVMVTVTTCVTVGVDVTPGRPDRRWVPLYLETDSTYGNWPAGQMDGVWGRTNAAGHITAYAARVWTQPVMDKLIDFLAAVGAKYDTDPAFEGIGFQEGFGMSYNAGYAVGQGGDVTATDANLTTQANRLWDSVAASLPHTNVFMQNTDNNGAQGTIDFENGMLSRRIAHSSADTRGASKLAPNAGADYGNWGTNTYAGFGGIYGTNDRRNIIPCMFVTDSPDFTTAFCNGTVADWLAGIDVLACTHQWVFVQNSNQNPPFPVFNWSALSPAMRGHSITKPYPPAASGYPQ